MPGQVVGRKGKRRDISDTPVVNLWKTDEIKDRDDDYVYEFPYAGNGDSWNTHDKVRDMLLPTQVTLTDYETGETQVHDIPAWEICHRKASEEEKSLRPDEGKPLDTVLRRGPHVGVRIPRKAWELLQKAQEQRADGYERRLNAGHTADFGVDGNERRPAGKNVAPGTVRLTEQPLARV